MAKSGRARLVMARDLYARGPRRRRRQGPLAMTQSGAGSHEMQMPTRRRRCIKTLDRTRGIKLIAQFIDLLSPPESRGV